MSNSNFFLSQLTIAIPVKNEESNLAVCLQAIGTDFSGRVVVIDSASRDATSDVACSYGAEVIDFHWDGHFPKKRNWFLRNHTPSTDWVFSMLMRFLLLSEARDCFCPFGSTHQGFLLSYTNYFLGRRLHGGYTA